MAYGRYGVDWMLINQRTDHSIPNDRGSDLPTNNVLLSNRINNWISFIAPNISHLSYGLPGSLTMTIDSNGSFSSEGSADVASIGTKNDSSSKGTQRSCDQLGKVLLMLLCFLLVGTFFSVHDSMVMSRSSENGLPENTEILVMGVALGKLISDQSTTRTAETLEEVNRLRKENERLSNESAIIHELIGEMLAKTKANHLTEIEQIRNSVTNAESTAIHELGRQLADMEIKLSAEMDSCFGRNSARLQHDLEQAKSNIHSTEQQNDFLQRKANPSVVDFVEHEQNAKDPNCLRNGAEETLHDSSIEEDKNQIDNRHGKDENQSHSRKGPLSSLGVCVIHQLCFWGCVFCVHRKGTRSHDVTYKLRFLTIVPFLMMTNILAVTEAKENLLAGLAICVIHFLLFLASFRYTECLRPLDPRYLVFVVLMSFLAMGAILNVLDALDIAILKMCTFRHFINLAFLIQSLDLFGWSFQ